MLQVVLVSGRERSAELAQVAGIGLTLLIWATCGDDLLSSLDSSSIVFIDWLLPCCSALECCRLIRSRPALQDAHLTVLLEHDDDTARREALRAGADDYLVGQSSLPEVLRRAAASTAGRCVGPRGGFLSVGSFVLNEESLFASYRERQIELNPVEFGMLRRFLASPGEILSRSELQRAMGRPESRGRARGVDVWIARLRRSLAQAGAAHHLRTAAGRGYALELG